MHSLRTDPATITSGLQSLVTNESFSTHFTCTIMGIPQPTITWSRGSSTEGNFTTLTNTTKIVISTDAKIAQFNLYVITTSLEVKNLVKEDDEAYYRCSAVNNVENLIQAENESTALLTINGNY